MTEDELKKIWQSSPNIERIKFEKSRLMLDVQSSLDKLHRRIKYRDLTEQIAALAVIPLFLLVAWFMPFILTKVASLLIVCWCLFVVYRLRQAKRNQPGPLTGSYLEYLQESKRYLQIQKKLLDSVLFWYILPPMILYFLFVLGIDIEGRESILWKMGIGAVGVAIAIYVLNKKAVQDHLVPRLTKIDELIESLQRT